MKITQRIKQVPGLCVGCGTCLMECVIAHSGPHDLVGSAVDDATADFEFDISVFSGPELYAQVVVEPAEVSMTLGYATDTAPVLLAIEGENGPR